ncbi:DNA polymerase beta [Agrilus planipennis]|uniref:DNA polymerase n=1 Tax=Agrilus planipennis TaxID=224129 RepID=A0A1W4WRT3_AGRPL|nr:DNA polymerase beta [Agrilus planipennis]
MSKRKNPSGKENPNHEICEILSELAEYEKNVSRNIYKYNAYRKAAMVIATHPKKLQSGEEAKHLKGVGEKIAKKIDEILSTGKLRKLEEIHSDDASNAITLLTRVSGIGPAKARQLVDHGIKTIEQLKKHKDKLNHHQLIGLKYFEDFEKKIPRKEIEEMEKIIKEEVHKLDGDYKITICGSYRRGKLEISDIDILVTHPKYSSSDHEHHKKNTYLENIVECLKKYGLITETISLGESKFMGACKLKEDTPTRRIDIRFMPCDQYYCGILYFTGSNLFNQEMRAHAHEEGFLLNEYALKPLGSTGTPGEPVEIHSEKDIFEAINYPYKKPEERNI